VPLIPLRDGPPFPRIQPFLPLAQFVRANFVTEPGPSGGDLDFSIQIGHCPPLILPPHTPVTAPFFWLPRRHPYRIFFASSDNLPVVPERPVRRWTAMASPVQGSFPVLATSYRLHCQGITRLHLFSCKRHPIDAWDASVSFLFFFFFTFNACVMRAGSQVPEAGDRFIGQAPRAGSPTL